jgi:hypothetical protein
MSLKLKCFATVIQDSTNETEGNIEIHSTLHNLTVQDFANAIVALEKEYGTYSINITIGEKESKREIPLPIAPIFTKYAYEIKNRHPIPLINQPISSTKNEKSHFTSSRFWAFQKYFFVTNRNYSIDEIPEVKLKILFIVKNFENELMHISEELKNIGL